MYIIEGDVVCECDLMTKGKERLLPTDRAVSLSIGHGNIGVRASGFIIERSKTDSNVVRYTSDPARCQEQYHVT